MNELHYVTTPSILVIDYSLKQFEVNFPVFSSLKIIDLANILARNFKLVKIIGIRPR